MFGQNTFRCSLQKMLTWNVTIVKIYLIICGKVFSNKSSLTTHLLLKTFKTVENIKLFYTFEMGQIKIDCCTVWQNNWVREAFNTKTRWNLGKVPNRGGGSTRWPGIPNLLTGKTLYNWKVSQTPWNIQKSNKKCLLKMLTR